MTSTQRVVPLHSVAHARAGDKANRCSISLCAYDPAHWDVLVEQVTEERVAQLFTRRAPTSVTRYLLPRLHAMNFVIDDVLDGGVNEALNLDSHGKTLSGLLLRLPIEVPADLKLRQSSDGPALVAPGVKLQCA